MQYGRGSKYSKSTRHSLVSKAQSTRGLDSSTSKKNTTNFAQGYACAYSSTMAPMFLENQMATTLSKTIYSHPVLEICARLSKTLYRYASSQQDVLEKDLSENSREAICSSGQVVSNG